MKRISAAWSVSKFVSAAVLIVSPLGCTAGVATSAADDTQDGNDFDNGPATGAEDDGDTAGLGDDGSDIGDKDGDAQNEEGDGSEPAPSQGPGVRPEGNTGKGFYVSGRTIYDANDQPFEIRGINNNHWWGGEADDTWWTGDNVASIAELAKTGANSARVVLGPVMGADTPAERRALVEEYIANGVVPIVEDHRAIGGRTAEELFAAVAAWLDPENVEWLKKYERQVILNIANEWGPAGSSPSELALFRDAYMESIRRIREAGINALLIIDAHQYGQRIEGVIQYGSEILAADPQKNVAFAQHLYGYWSDPGASTVNAWGDGTPYDMEAALTALEDTGLAIVIGEFGWQETEDIAYTTRGALDSFAKHDFGWIAWAFNLAGGHDIVRDYTYDSEDDLTPYGQLIVNDPELGLKATSVKASIF